MQDDGKQHALPRQAGIAEYGFAQFKVAAGTNGEKFGKTLYDSEDDSFNQGHEYGCRGCYCREWMGWSGMVV